MINVKVQIQHLLPAEKKNKGFHVVGKIAKMDFISFTPYPLEKIAADLGANINDIKKLIRKD